MEERGRSHSSRALGLGLLLTAGILGALALLWLILNLSDGSLSAGGLTCGLALMAVIVLPLAASGAYLISRARSEAKQALQMAQARALLDADLLARQRLAQDLSRLSRQLSSESSRLPTSEADSVAKLRAASDRLAHLASTVLHDRSDEWALISSLIQHRRDPQILRSYDTLLSERSRQLSRQIRDLGQPSERPRPSQVEDIAAAVDQIEAAYQQRRDLLIEARQPSGAAIDRLAVDPMVEESRRLTRLAIGDVITYGGVDYLVHGKLSYFSERSPWIAYLLRDSQVERWLHLSSSGTDLVFYAPVHPPPVPPMREVDFRGERFLLQGQGSASVRIETADADDSDIFVEFWRLTSDKGAILWIERWPSGARARIGHEVSIYDVETFSRSA